MMSFPHLRVILAYSENSHIGDGEITVPAACDTDMTNTTFYFLPCLILSAASRSVCTFCEFGTSYIALSIKTGILV